MLILSFNRTPDIGNKDRVKHFSSLQGSSPVYPGRQALQLKASFSFAPDYGFISLDRRAGPHRIPDLIHGAVGNGNAAVGPVELLGEPGQAFISVLLAERLAARADGDD